MRLLSVEAVRYGAFSDVLLGELGENLTLVVGRNEAGKSTFTSLIRHVLYGFPRGRVIQRQYLPPTGDPRVGRLTFVEDSGETTVERIEGAHGGVAVVRGPQGEEPGEVLLAPLTAGVSGAVYRTVFGFSLEELSDLGSLADIQSRLYATTAGLGVNPQDVLQKLRTDADALWAPRARTKRLHELNRERRAIRDDRARLAEIADEYRADHEERASVVVELEGVEGELRSARHGHARLASLLTEARRLIERMEEDERAADEHRSTVDRLLGELAQLEIDEDLLENAAEVDRLGARFELFRSNVAELRRDEERLREVDGDVERRLQELGANWTLETLEGLDLDLELEDQLHEQEEKLREAQRRRDDSSRQLADARTERDVAVAAAEKQTEGIEIPAESRAAEVVGARLEAVDRLLILHRQMDARAPSPFPGLAATVVAVGMVVWGLTIDEPQVLWAAAPPALLAVAFFLWTLLRRRVPAEVGVLVGVLGLENEPSGEELVEIKSRLEEARRAWLGADALGQTAEARERAAEIDENTYTKATRAWAEWLKAHQLQTVSGSPVAAHRVLQTLREVRGHLDTRGGLERELARRRAECEGFTADAKKIDGGIADDRGEAQYDGVARGVQTMVERLEAVRRNDEQRRDLARRKEVAREGLDSTTARIEKTGARLKAILDDSELGDQPSIADLEAAEAVAGEELVELEAERERLVKTRATLEGRLQRGVDESSSADLRLAEAGIGERIDDALESYVVTAAAAQILEEALEAYEAERQPAVIQRAQEVFSALTGGRYTNLATPLGRFKPIVSGGEDLGKAPEQLSRSTAEQLFLALRLSYIENLASAHPALPVLMDDILVNFDRDRRLAAAAVIADFASRRQVVFFTCQTQTVEAFVEAAPDFTVIELGE